MTKDEIRFFTEGQLEIISKCLGNALTGSEIGHMLSSIGVYDPEPNITKWKRLYNAFVYDQNKRKAGNKVLSFIKKSIDPVRFVNNINTFKIISEELNSVLAFHGLEYRDDGKYYNINKIISLTESQKRAAMLKIVISERRLNEELLKYCREELLVDNYFHAVFEATKGLFDIIRKISGLSGDGSELVDKAFTGNKPLIKINKYVTKTEISEQAGFVNLLKGIYGVFRNPIAHELKIEWTVSEQDALDLFSTLSYLYRRILNIKS